MLRESDSNAPPSFCTVVPPHIAAILGSPALLRTEDREAYEQLVVELALEWDPRGPTEWLSLFHFAHTSCDIVRLQRAIANILNIATKEGLAGIFMDVLPGYRRSLTLEGTEAHSIQARQAQERADAWFEGPEQQERVKSELAKFGLGPDAIE